jgi:hypothetical protein
MIVIEGPDGAGKTTLAKQLAADLKLEYHHEGPPPKDISPLDHYGRVLEDFRRNKTDVVIDRFAYGERVYGPILRGKDNLGHVGWKLMVRLMRACSVVPIYCLPEFGECYTNWSSGRPELIKDPQQFKRTYDLWLHHVKGGDLGYLSVIYDYANWPYHEFAHYMRRHLLRDVPRPLPTGVIGNPLSKFLFVGDIGSNPRAHVDLPFWSDRGSSEYLNDALTVAGFHENDVAMVNARRHDGQRQEIPTEGYWEIIALGRQASEQLRGRAIRHKVVPHPQYWKRFHNADIKGYADKLRKAASRP